MMESVSTLNTARINDIYYVKMLSVDGDMRRRLQDLGLIEGTRVKCVLKSPAGNPAAYLIRGAVIALRNEDSEKIFVTKE